jgi:transcriptional regulator with XRE-family HTH domain
MSLDHLSSGRGLMDVRRTLGLSREELAEMLDTSSRTIERQESGRGPILKTLSRIANMTRLNVSLSIDGCLQKPLTLAISNPSASSGCSTLCICLAGFLVSRRKRVKVVFGGPDQAACCRILEERSDRFPMIDFTAVSDSRELSATLQNAERYDVLLVDCPRIRHGEGNWEESYIPFLETLRDSVDLVIVPLKYGYPRLERSLFPCFHRDLTELFLREPDPKVLLVMNEVGIRRHFNSNFVTKVNDFLGTTRSSNVSLARTRIGSRSAYATVGLDTNALGWKLNGSTPHDVSGSRSHADARKEIESLWVEISGALTDRPISTAHVMQ